MDGTLPQAIEPCYRRGSKPGREHFTLKTIVPRIEDHELSEVANMLNRIDLSIITNERQVSKVPQKMVT